MDTIQRTFISMNVGTLIISCPGNIFIMVVIVQNFFKFKRLLLSEQLILGFSVFSLLYALQKGYIQCRDLLQLGGIKYNNNIIFGLTYLNMCILWFSALLSLHFCLKIVNINHRFYVGLQRRFPMLFPWIIFAFLLGQLFLSLAFALQTEECFQNTTSKVVVFISSPRCSKFLIIFITICGLCTFICLLSAFTILISLLKHIKRIQGNTEGSGSPNMDVHLRAVRTVTTLLAANFFVFLSLLTIILMTPIVNLSGVLISICLIFSSYFLIKGTKQLNKPLEEILKRCSWFC